MNEDTKQIVTVALSIVLGLAVIGFTAVKGCEVSGKSDAVAAKQRQDAIISCTEKTGKPLECKEAIHGY